MEAAWAADGWFRQMQMQGGHPNRPPINHIHSVDRIEGSVGPWSLFLRAMGNEGRGLMAPADAV